MKKLRHKEVKLFAQGHTATKCENLAQESKVAKLEFLFSPYQPNHLGKVNEPLLASHLHFENNTYLIEVLCRLKKYIKPRIGFHRDPGNIALFLE